MRKRAYIRVSLDAMKKVLGLPDSTVVIAVTSDPDEQLFMGAFDLVIEHEDLYENNTSCMPMPVTPSQNGNGEFIWEHGWKVWEDR